jgi:hypothetical protein
MSHNRIALLLAPVVLVLPFFAACAGGPSDGEFVQACLSSNERGLNMVKMTEEMCKCAATYARENFAPPVRQAMTLNLQGRKQESEALLQDMSFEERAKFATQQFEMVGKCLDPR